MGRWFLAIQVLACAATSASAQDLARQFADPPHEYSLVPFWSWNGTLKPDELRRQMDQMVDKGVYGAFMHARAGLESGTTPYFSEGWWRAVDTCMDYGPGIGFHPWIYDEDKWPSGAAGGRTLARNPERNVGKALRRVEQTVTGPAEVRIAMPGARYIVAARLLGEKELDPASVRQLPAQDQPGAPADFAWQCPEGKWLVLGYVFTPLPHGAINYMNAETVRDFIDITHEQYARRYGDRFGKDVPGLFFDEIGNDGGRKPDLHAWVEGFEQRFRELKGYDLAPLLPALAYDIGPETPKIRCDYYDAYATLYEEAWFKQIGDWCQAHGLLLTGHTIEDPKGYLSQADYARTMKHLHIPMTDNEDFRYTWPRTIGAWKPKQIASIGHQYGRPRVGVEAMGGAGWAFTPEMGRYGLNMLAAYGVNFFVPHLFHYAQDSPANVDDWPNSWFYQNPYWKYFKTFADHARRVSFMLTGGQPIVDVAVLYPQANQWAGNDCGTLVQTVETLTALPIDVDVIDPASLLRGTVNDGTLAVGDVRYRAIILPSVQCIRRAEADTLRAFVNGGGLLIVHDRWPTDSAEVGRDDAYLAQFRRDAEAKGILPISLSETAQALAAQGTPDLVVKSGPASALRYCHVRREGLDIYWVVNGAKRAGLWTLSLRATGAVTRWQPEDGSVTPQSSASAADGRTECPVALDAGQGCFLVLDPKQPSAATPQSAPLAPPSPPMVLPLDGDWEMLPVGASLDNKWTDDVRSAELELPVMYAHWQQPSDAPGEDFRVASYDHARWNRIKVLDTLHPEAGTSRTRSHWNARFISHNPVREFTTAAFFKPQIGGKGFKCRTTFTLAPDATDGRLAVVCQSPFRAVLNGREIYKGSASKDGQEFALSGLRPGDNLLAIETENAEALLAEGQVASSSGPVVPIATDATWDTAIEGEEWTQAWKYVAPPEKPFGEPARPGYSEPPSTLWLRQPLPPGTCSMREPRVDGAWEAWVNGTPLTFRNGSAKVACPDAPSVLAIKVVTTPEQHGLLEPVRVVCKPTRRPLGSWTQQGLDWYSGRTLYTRTFSMDRDVFASKQPIELDLGRVAYCAEVWVNGKLAGTRIWPPYRVDITPYVRAGKNRVSVVVANLLANRMRWDIFDDVKGELGNRKWHDMILRRDAWCFESGLVGPVVVRVGTGESGKGT